MGETKRRSMKIRIIVTAVLALLILVPSMLGFADKFRQLIILCQGNTDGAFAITPVVNYLLASFGFFCLLCWAALNGMFRDVEKPKRQMLETEAMLDENDPREAATHAVTGYSL